MNLTEQKMITILKINYKDKIYGDWIPSDQGWYKGRIKQNGDNTEQALSTFVLEYN